MIFKVNNMEFFTERLRIKTEIVIKDKSIDFDYYKPSGVDVINMKACTGLEYGFKCYSKLLNAEICHIGFDNVDGKTEISFGTEKQFRNQKYMSEALPAVIEWIFSNTCINDLYARIGKNDISEHILQKIGFCVTSEEYLRPGKLYKLSRRV